MVGRRVREGRGKMGERCGECEKGNEEVGRREGRQWYWKGDNGPKHLVTNSKSAYGTDFNQWPGLILSLSGRLLMEQVKGKKVKAFPYLIPSTGPGADPRVQAVSQQVTVSHPPGGRLPLLSARPAVTSPAAEHHRPLAGTRSYCLVTEAHRCKQLV